MPIRNPFRRAGAPEQADDALRIAPENGFKNAPVSGTQPLQLKDPAEYKLSGETPSPCVLRAVHCVNRRLLLRIEINDSGVYLPVSASHMPSCWIRPDERIVVPEVLLLRQQC